MAIEIICKHVEIRGEENKSGTGRILMVDGEPQTLNKESGPLLDYYCYTLIFSDRFDMIFRRAVFDRPFSV